MERWESAGYEESERDDLRTIFETLRERSESKALDPEAAHAWGWNPLRHDHLLQKLDRGLVTDEMVATLLLTEVWFRQWMAVDGYDDDAAAALAFYRETLIARARVGFSSAERAVLDELDALEQRRVTSEPPLDDDEIQAALGAIDRRYPDLFDELGKLHVRAQESSKATVPRALRDMATKSRRLPYSPIGARVYWKRKAKALRDELGEPFITGTFEYRQRRIRGWRRGLKARPAGSNSFAHFEGEGGTTPDNGHCDNPECRYSAQRWLSSDRCARCEAALRPTDERQRVDEVGAARQPRVPRRREAHRPV